MTPHLLIFGLGYTGRAVALAAQRAGFAVTATFRRPIADAPVGVALVPAAAAGEEIARATHLLTTAAPDESGDPVLAQYRGALEAARQLGWIGYFSTTGVYGDRDGAWVDETTEPAPGSPRTRRRAEAEQAWAAIATGKRFDIFRIAGIYGPGRSAFDDLLAGTARRTEKPGHAFGRIHRDDIAAAALAAMRQERPAGARVLNLADDEPAESARVVEEAAQLLGITPPPLVRFAEAARSMSPMALSFWAENRRVSSAATKAALGIAWKYPTYRDGLRAILTGENS